MTKPTLDTQDEFKSIEELAGHTMRGVSRKAGPSGDELHFERADGKRFKFYHDQDCCESVNIADVCGDLDDLVGAPLLQAEYASRAGAAAQYDDSETWTFYKFATINGSVTVTWLGNSNGYYSERVDFTEIK